MGLKLAAGNVVLKLHDGTALRDLSAYVVGVDGLPGDRETLDATAFTDAGRVVIPGPGDGRFSVEFLFDDGANTTWDVLRTLHADRTARAFEYYPDGVKKVSGTCYLTALRFTARAGEPVRATAEFQAQGAVAFA